MKDVLLVTGCEGLMGAEILSAARDADGAGFEVRGTSHQDLDISDRRAVQACFREARPAYVVNCAAYRDIDKAELDREAARRVNAEGARNLAEACAAHGTKLVHLSSHGIFDGEKSSPYLESDSPNPLNHYAATKLQGEEYVQRALPPARSLVLRISWPYGPRNNNFIKAILEFAKKNGSVRVVHDQIGVPNPARLLAKSILSLAREASGLLHLSCRGHCSRYEFISRLFALLGLGYPVFPASVSEFPGAAVRPKNMAIATEIASWDRLASLPPWDEALERYIRESPEMI